MNTVIRSQSPRSVWRSVVVIAIIITFVIGLAPVARATPPPGGYVLVWQDNFATDTALDLTHWTHMWQGTFNGDVNTPAAAVLGNGYLALKAYTQNNVQYADIIGTRYKYQPKYGYVEATIRWADSPGTWSALWTFGNHVGGTNGLYLPHTDGIETDIAEHRAVTSTGLSVADQIDIALHWDGYDIHEKSTGPSGLIGAGLNTGFHTYGVAWTPTSQTFYVDNVVKWTQTNDATDADPLPPLSPVSQVSQYLLLSMIVQTGTWAGNTPAGGYGSLQTTTTEMDIQNIKVYQLGPPAPLAPVQVTVGPATGGGWMLGWGLTDNAPYYNVKRSTTKGGPYTTIATTGIANPGACYADTTAVAGTTYYYVVSAVNGTVEGPNSLEVCTSAVGTPCVAHSGSWAAEGIFSGTAGFNNIRQTATVAANTDYQAGFWARGGGKVTLRLYNSSNTQVAIVIVSPTPAWTYYSLPATFNTGANTQLTLKVDDESSQAAAISVDDFFMGPPGGANVLVNAGFENGTTSWDFSNAGTVWTANNCGGPSSGNQNDGYQGLRGVFAGTPTFDRITQTTWVTPNTTYQAGFWAKGAGRTTLRIYQGNTGTQISTTLIVTPTSTWTYYSTTFNSGSNTQVTLRLDDYSNVAATMYVDDVFLGLAGGANLLVNSDFELGTVGWDSTYAATVWSIGQY